MRSDKSQRCKFSVVIPCYNAADFIADTLYSIKNQNYPFVEVIVADGSSTDSTVDIARSIFPDATIVSEPDKGQLDALQKGVSLATGDIIHWLNADDIMMPGALQAVNTAFRESPSSDVVISDDFAFNEARRELYKGATIKGLDHDTHILFYRQMYSECVYWRSQATRLLGDESYSLRVYTDYAFLANITRGRRIKWLPKRLGAFRVREDQASVTFSERKASEFNLVRSRLRIARGWSSGSIPLRKAMAWPKYSITLQVAPLALQAFSKLSRLADGGRQRNAQCEAFYEWLKHRNPTTPLSKFSSLER